MLPTKFQVSWPFISGEDVKNRFSRWQPLWPCWISNWNDFSSFLFTSHPDASFQVSSQFAFQFRRRSEKLDFQDDGHGHHLGFPIRTILATFDLQVTPMLPSQLAFQFGRSEKEIFNMAATVATLDFGSEQF